MKRKSKLNRGSVCIFRAKASGGGFKKNWMMKLKWPDKPDRLRSSEYGVCPLCLTEERPTKTRESCRCQVPAREVAEGWLDDERVAFEAGRSSARDMELAEKAVLRWKEVKPVYLANGPASAKDNWERLEAIVEEVTGKPLGDQPVTVPTWPQFLDWVQMRQEYFRRGWSKRGGVPVEVKYPWAALRADLKGGRLPAIDKDAVVAGNTTIKGYLNAARAVLGGTSRSEYLRHLQLPPMEGFWDGRVCKLSLPSPVGHREMDAERYKAMYEAAEVLMGTDLRLWVIVQMLWRFGCRPCEVSSARCSWIEHDAEGPMFVIRNRYDEPLRDSGKWKGQVFKVKAKSRAVVRRLRIAPDLWAAMQAIMTPGADGYGSLLGASTTAMAEAWVDKLCSAWVGQFTGEDTHTNYLLRHYVGTLVRQRYGLDTAAAWLGHVSGTTITGGRMGMTESRYAGNVKALPALTWEDLAPARV
jgi:integrase